MVGRTRAAAVAAVAVLCVAAMTACTGDKPRPAPAEPPPALSAQKLPAVGDVPGMVQVSDFLVMPGSGVLCDAVQARITALERAAKSPPDTEAVALSNTDRSRRVVVGVWTYPRNDATGAPAKQLAELDQLMPACTFGDKIGGRPAKVTVDAPVVTGAPAGTRVFRVTTRSNSRVVMQIVLVYITRPGSLLAVEDLRTGPAFPVSETVTFAAAALVKSST